MTNEQILSEIREANLTYLSLWYTLGHEYGMRDGELTMRGGSSVRSITLMVKGEYATGMMNRASVENSRIRDVASRWKATVAASRMR